MAVRVRPVAGTRGEPVLGVWEPATVGLDVIFTRPTGPPVTLWFEPPPSVIGWHWLAHTPDVAATGGPYETADDARRTAWAWIRSTQGQGGGE